MLFTCGERHPEPNSDSILVCGHTVGTAGSNLGMWLSANPLLHWDHTAGTTCLA